MMMVKDKDKDKDKDASYTSLREITYSKISKR